MVNQQKPGYTKRMAAGYTFVFKFDDTDPTVLHIFARHLKQPKDAMWAWFNGQHAWNQEHQRFEGQSGEVGIHWFWINYDQAVVMVSSCFKSHDR